MTSRPRPILLGTGNRKKLAELRAFFAGRPVELLCPADLDPVPPPPPETGLTFEDNALEKALAYARATGLWCLADDSGLEVDALSGRPGVHSARYAGPNASDAENNALLLRELAGVPPGQRGGGYVSVLVLADAERLLASARGTCRGELLAAPRGDGGFGYDPLFFVPGLGRTFAELGTAEKELISHRGIALRALAPKLDALLRATPRVV